MLNNCTFFGRVISEPRYNQVGDKSVLNFTVSVPTGQPKKDDGYPPSVLVETALWGKYADAMSSLITSGSQVIISGNLYPPKTWISGTSNEAKANVVLGGNVNVTLVGDRKESEESAPTTSNKSKKNSNVSVPKDMVDVDLFS